MNVLTQKWFFFRIEHKQIYGCIYKNPMADLSYTDELYEIRKRFRSFVFNIIIIEEKPIQNDRWAGYSSVFTLCDITCFLNRVLHVSDRCYEVFL